MLPDVKKVKASEVKEEPSASYTVKNSHTDSAALANYFEAQVEQNGSMDETKAVPCIELDSEEKYPVLPSVAAGILAEESSQWMKAVHNPSPPGYFEKEKEQYAQSSISASFAEQIQVPCDLCGQMLHEGGPNFSIWMAKFGLAGMLLETERRACTKAGKYQILHISGATRDVVAESKRAIEARLASFPPLVEMPIPAEKWGELIGVRGENIKQLKILLLRGEVDRVKMAKQYIEAFFASDSKWTGVVSEELIIPAHVCTAIMENGFAVLHRIKQATDTHIVLNTTREDSHGTVSGDRQLTISGPTKKGVEQAKQMILDTLAKLPVKWEERIPIPDDMVHGLMGPFLIQLKNEAQIETRLEHDGSTYVLHLVGLEANLIWARAMTNKAFEDAGHKPAAPLGRMALFVKQEFEIARDIFSMLVAQFGNITRQLLASTGATVIIDNWSVLSQSPTISVMIYGSEVQCAEVMSLIAYLNENATALYSQSASSY